ncbi:hypothetical protein HYT18_05330 [Candidatus Microgenomates bacterium]|nr:hypothetical protein [Candidatus Microgenomates bacterium]
MPSKQKLYCYVDETGQDTLGEIFVVTVVVPQNRDEVLRYVENVEIQSGKGKFKWGRAKPDKRIKYLETIFSQRKYPLKIYYSYYKDTKEYKTQTILTITKAVFTVRNFKEHRFIVAVDGLSQKDQKYYGSELRKLGVPSREVKGIARDQTNALIRLADSIAGFVRDIIENKDKDEKLKLLYKKAIQENVLVEV